jgi:hypothetical protein
MIYTILHFFFIVSASTSTAKQHRKNIAMSRYKPVVKALMKKKAFKSAVFEACGKLIQKEIHLSKNNKDLRLRENISLATLEHFRWDECVKEMREVAPNTLSILGSMLSPTDIM